MLFKNQLPAVLLAISPKPRAADWWHGKNDNNTIAATVWIKKIDIFMAVKGAEGSVRMCVLSLNRFTCSSDNLFLFVRASDTIFLVLLLLLRG